MTGPYWSDDQVQLFIGDCREVLPALGVTADLIVADPPYQVTSLKWDRWPDGWLNTAATVASSLWCWLPFRQFASPPFRGMEFRAAGWKLSHDMIMEKGAGQGVTSDRLRCVHEPASHWYRGRWDDIYHVAPRVPHDGPNAGSRARGHVPLLTGGARPGGRWVDDGMRYARSVQHTKARRGGSSIHPNEKPVHILRLMVELACPPGGLVVDPFAGSGSTLEAARLTGRRCIGIEADERYAEKAARRLSQALPLELAP